MPESHQQPADHAGPRIRPGDWYVIVFTALYLAVSLVAAVTSGNREFVMYLAVMVVLIGVVVAVHLQVNLATGALWGLSIWGLAHMAGGLVHVPDSWPTNTETPVLYNLWLIPQRLKYDQVVHAFGFGMVTWICWQALAAAFARRGIKVQPTLGLLSLCVAGGMGFGAGNEVVEFAAVLLLPGTNVGGYMNTGWDLVANLTGCLISATLIYQFAQEN